MFKQTAQLYVLVELEPAADATTVVNQVTWHALALPQLVKVVQSQESVAVWGAGEEALAEDSLLVADLQVDHVQQLATSAAGQITLLEIARPKQ